MSHTPGPWHISKGGRYVRKNDGPNWPAWNVAEINQDHDRATADAHLIAAAPDLLAACEAIVRDSEARPGAYIHARGLDELRAAIAKARA